MAHGHLDAIDDSILETGNKVQKGWRRCIFWAGTNEVGASYFQPWQVLQSDGTYKEVLVERRANVGGAGRAGREPAQRRAGHEGAAADAEAAGAEAQQERYGADGAREGGGARQAASGGALGPRG